MNLLSEQVEKDLYQSIINVVERTIEKNAERTASDQRYLRPEEAATYCGVSPQSLTRWVNQHELKQIKIGNVVSYDRKDLDHFMIKHKI